MATTVQKIYPSGLYQINGTFDEVTYNPNSGITKNLLSYSQDFTQTSTWSAQIAVTLTKTNAVTAPDGSNTAIQYYLSAPSGRGVDQHINFVTGTTYTFSIYLNAIQNTTYYLSHVDASTTVITAQSGAITTGTGWNRVSFTFTATTATSFIQFQDLSGNTGNMFYCWGSQLEIGTTPTIYQGTVANATPISGVTRKNDPAGNLYIGGILDEVTYNPSYTYTKNFIPNSNNIPVEWNYLVNATPITTSTLAPDGSATAVKLTSSNTSSGYIFMATGLGVYDLNVPGLYTFSIYAKAAEWSVIGLSNGPPGGVNFNLSTGQLLNVIANYTTGTITNVGNGWYRISGTCSSEAWGQFYVTMGTNTNYSVQSSVGGQGVYLWGPQFELGVTPTIYEATGPSGVPAPTFASRVDSQGNLYSPNYYDEITSQITWTFTVTSLYTSQTSGHKGIQSKFIGGLSDSNYYYDNSCWGSGLEPYPSITAIFPTTYYVSNVYLGPVENAGIPSGGGGWGTTWTRGSLQSSFDRLAWSTLTNLGQSYFSGGTDVTRVIPVNTTANYIRLVSNNTSSWWTPGVADFLAAAEFYFDATPASSYQNPTVTSGLALYLDAGYGYSYPGSGPTWYDLSGANNNMVLSNSPTYSSSNGGYFSLNGTSQSFTATSTTSYTISNGLTVGAWVNWSSFSTYGIILSHQSSLTTNDGWRFRTPGSNSLAFTLGAVADYYGCTASLNTNTWYYVAVSVSGNNGTATYYVNGQPAGSTAINTMQGTPTVFQVGSDFASQFYTGRISSVHMYPRALSVLEINQNFQALRSRYGI